MADEQVAFVPATEQPFASSPAADDPPSEVETNSQAEQQASNEPTDDNASEPSDELDEELKAAQQEAEQAEQAELEEFEWDGKTISGPKGLKEGVMLKADYTRKTQEVAERRKELDTLSQQIDERAKATDEELTLRGQQWAQKAEIEEYQKIDWEMWMQQDASAAQSAWMRYQNLLHSQTDLDRKLTEATTMRSREAQQDLAKRIGETREFAQKNIKGYTPEVEQRVIGFALEQGLSQGQLQANMSPVVFDLLHKAMIGAEVLKKPAAPPTKPTTPLRTVSSRSNSPVRKPLEEMNMDEYVKARTAQGYSSG